MAKRGRKILSKVKESVDCEELIRLVRDKPMIYDNRHSKYKRHAWLEIARIILSEWSMCSSQVQADKLHYLQTRWRSMRDAYRKHICHHKEVRSGSGVAPRVPYMFAGDLEFLQPIVEMRETEASWEEQDVLDDQPEAQPQIGFQEGTEDYHKYKASLICGKQTQKSGSGRGYPWDLLRYCRHCSASQIATEASTCIATRHK